MTNLPAKVPVIPDPAVTQTTLSPGVPPPNVNVHLLSHNGAQNKDPVYEYIKRQMTINQLGLNDMVVLQPSDINPVLMRRYEVVGSESETDLSENEYVSAARWRRQRRRYRNGRVPLRKYRR